MTQAEQAHRFTKDSGQQGSFVPETGIGREAVMDIYQRAQTLLEKYDEDGNLSVDNLKILRSYWKGFGRTSEGREKALELQKWAEDNQINLKPLLARFQKVDMGITREETSESGYVS